METNKTLVAVEEAVIGCLLTNRNAILEVAPLLREEMFTDARLAFVYRAVRAVNERGEQPDLITIRTEMNRLDAAETERLGGLSFLTPTLMRLRHTGNLAAYVNEIRSRHILRLLESLFTSLAERTRMADTDYLALMAEAEKSLLAIREEGMTGNGFSSLGELAVRMLAFHRNRYETGDESRRVRTGFNEFDFITGGLYNAELTVGAGRPGDGKSAVAIQMALNAAQNGKRVCFFSLEMNDLQIMNRIFAGQGGIDANHLRVAGLTRSDLEQMERLAERFRELPFYLNYTAATSVENIRAEALLKARKEECDLVVVDYLHLLDCKPQRGETLEQVIARNIRALKRLALEIDRPVLVLSQMNRASETRADRAHLPVMSDLRDSGTIEQVADCVFFVYRPERHGITKDEKTGESLAGIGKLMIMKNRNGATGTARYRYNESYTRLMNLENTLAL